MARRTSRPRTNDAGAPPPRLTPVASYVRTCRSGPACFARCGNARTSSRGQGVWYLASGDAEANSVRAPAVYPVVRKRVSEPAGDMVLARRRGRPESLANPNTFAPGLPKGRAMGVSFRAPRWWEDRWDW